MRQGLHHRAYTMSHCQGYHLLPTPEVPAPTLKYLHHLKSSVPLYDITPQNKSKHTDSSSRLNNVILLHCETDSSWNHSNLVFAIICYVKLPSFFFSFFVLFSRSRLAILHSFPLIFHTILSTLLLKIWIAVEKINQVC